MPAVEEALQHYLTSLRRDLHAHPELSWQEERSAAVVCRELERLGVPHRRVAGTGVVADLPGRGTAPRIALRADLDALPVQEETGLPFASEVEGVMHACGHDGHTTMLLGAARLLADEPDLPGPVRLLFQPAEEVGAGAKALIAEGVLEGVAAIFGGHIDVQHPTGTMIVHEGVVNASTDMFRITISGPGGHAARPHEAVDAVVVASLLVMAIQTIVSREVNPAHPSVITVGRVQAGTAPNVMAGSAVLEGTVRTNRVEVRSEVIEALGRVATSVGQLHDADVALSFEAGTPVLENGPEMTAIARRAAEQVVEHDAILPLPGANMGGEDFACYLEHVPGFFVRLGAASEDEEHHPTHSSRFSFDEGVLPIGARFYKEVVLAAQGALGRNPRR